MHHAFNDSQINNLFVKKNIVLRIIAIVLSFEVDGDVSLIYHKRIEFCKKTELGSFVSVSTFFLMAEQGALKWLEILSDSFSNNL